MPVENAEFIHQLDADRPTGGESISEGDDHLRAIKGAVKGTFPQVKGQVTATHSDLNEVPGLVTEVGSLRDEFDSLDKSSHGNVASCYWNPSFSEGDKLAYSHNVSSVIVDPADQSGMQTRIVFTTPLDDDPHYSFNLTPVNGQGKPTIITVVGVTNTHLSFLSWHFDEGAWVQLPGTMLSFSMMANDMDMGQ